MTALRIVHQLPCSAEVFWETLFFDPEFNRRLFLEHLRFPAWRVTDQRDGELVLERTVEVTPLLGELPGPLKAVLGSSLSYRESGRFDKQARTYTLTAVPSVLSDRLGVSGELSCKTIGEGRSERVFVAKVEARVFGVGGLLEKRILSDLQSNYDGSAVFIDRYLTEAKLARS